jgi:putative transposase
LKGEKGSPKLGLLKLESKENPMQVFGLPGHVIRNGKTASRLLAAKTPDIAARTRCDAVARWRQAMARGLSAADGAQAVGVARANLYRWEKRPEPKSRRPKRVRAKTWRPALVMAVERLRLDYPMWGRAKLGPLIRAEGFAASDATVGRIIVHLTARGVVQPVPVLRKRSHARRWSPKRRFAVRLPKDLKSKEPGAIVQLDTVFITLEPGKSIKHFTAYDPAAKWTVGQAFNRATAASAARFLDKVIGDMPVKPKAIQVDGGSEFMAQFEAACQEKGIRLFVLPPKSPKLNGAVERCNSAWRYEFYETYDLPKSVEALNPILDSFQHIYNHYRPHGALAGLTPKQYLDKQRADEAAQSHMY